MTGTPATEEELRQLREGHETLAFDEPASSKIPSSKPTPLDGNSGETSDYFQSSANATPRPVYMLQHHPSQLSIQDRALNLGNHAHKRYPITPTTVPGHPGAGMGRVIRLAQPVALTDIIDRIGLGLGNPKGFPIAIPQGREASDMQIRSVALCAGSGGSLFAQMEKNGEDDVDLYFTGELSHHEALAAIEKGKCVICLFHSNTERGFLHSVLKGQLEIAVAEEVCPIICITFIGMCCSSRSS